MLIWGLSQLEDEWLEVETAVLIGGGGKQLAVVEDRDGVKFDV